MVMLMLLMIVRCYGDDADVADEASCKPAYVIIVVMLLLMMMMRMRMLMMMMMLMTPT